MNKKYEGLDAELKCRETGGHKPVSVKEMQDALKVLGYRMDRSMDAPHMARYISGPHAGRAYPCISTGVIEIDTGKSFAHFEARKDENFNALQKLRYEQSLFAVVRGRILSI